MMAELAKWDLMNRVIFVNPLLSIRTVVKRNSGSLNSSINNYHKLLPSHITPKLIVYTPINILPYKRYLAPLKKFGIRIMLGIIRLLNSDKPYILFMNCPNIFSHYILDELLKDAKLSVFDFSDDFVELSYGMNTTELFRRNVTKYAQKADIVLAVNDHIKKKYSFLNTNIHVIRNATNYDNFDRKNYKIIDFLERLKSSKKPIIGYSGIANMSRIDSNILDFLLEKKPDWQFVFIGPAKVNFLEKYMQNKNVHHIPPVNYDELPNYIYYFDVAIVPFKKNEHTKGNDLLKLHDYLAMGKPVVSTDIGGAEDLKDLISIAQNPLDFLGQIEKTLFNSTLEDVVRRKKMALKNSWHNRIKEVESLIVNFLSPT